jgi:uncharacterized protein YjbI with pentapeptide repeats
MTRGLARDLAASILRDVFPDDAPESVDPGEAIIIRRWSDNAVIYDGPRYGLCGRDLECADLTGADLSGLDMIECNLRGARLRRANLRGTRLAYADLMCADLTDADLTGAVLYGASLMHAIMPAKSD